jgi:hypothetical protein
MSNLFKKAIQLITGETNSSDALTMPKDRQFKKLTERQLLNLESQIGSSLFGPVPAGRRREFFCLDENTWIWHEEWKDEKGVQQQSTTRYEVHDKGILKVQEGARYSYLSGEELDNLLAATRLYYEKVARDIYKRDPGTGQKFA